MPEPSRTACFAQTYAEARRKFVVAAGNAGLPVDSVLHPGVGRFGEPLALDVVRDGPASAGRLLVISSACHGVEGFGGSGMQVALLGDAAVREAAHAAGVALLYLHALNPHGFSWWRRVTEDNVDLNRNFHDFTRPLPPNEAYDQLADLLLPPTWPPAADNETRLFAYAAEHGERAFQQAVSGGQYRHPQGLFYGGSAATWSHRTLRSVLRQQGSTCRHLAWIDLHTGLGPGGYGEKILAGREDAETRERACRWWGDDVTSTDDGTSTSAMLNGQVWQAAYEECPQARYTGITLEYGTRPALEVLDALRADHWMHRVSHQHPQAAAAQCASIQRRMRDAFYTDTDDWKARVVAQGVLATRQAIAGLGRDI